MSGAPQARKQGHGTEVIRLRTGVRRVTRPSGPLLVSPEGVAVRVGASVDDFYPLLMEGARFEELAARLRDRHPSTREIDERLRALLQQLENSQLLECGEVERRSTTPARPLLSLDVDPLAKGCARALGQAPWPLRLAALGSAMLAALAGVLTLLTGPLKPSFYDAFIHFSGWGLALVLGVVVPLHELGHAIAARCVGVRVNRLCVGRGALGFPRPYVETPEALLVVESWRRFWIPCGGPLANFLLGGAAAWVAVATERAGGVGAAATLVFLYCLMSVIVGTSPLRAGDGSHMLEALLDDDHARLGALLGRPSRLSSPRGLQLYRSVAGIHTLLTAVLLVWLLR